MPFIGQQPTTGAFLELDSLTASATANYTLQLNGANYYPESVNNLLVSINGVIQGSSTMSLNGAVLTVGATLSDSDVIDFVRVFGNVGTISTPTDGSVTANKIGTGAVTNVKIADSAVTNAKINNSTIDLTTKVTGILPNANIIGQTTRPSFYAANLNGATFNSGTLTGADAGGYGYTNGSMSYNSSTGELTVPIAGLYMIAFGILLNPNSGRCEANVQIQPSGGSYGSRLVVDANGTSTYDTCGASFTLPLGANDKIKIGRNSGTAYAFAHPSHFINVAYIGA